MKPYERTCRCGWWHRGLRALGFNDGHSVLCDKLYALGFRAYVAEQRAHLQEHHSFAYERLEAALLDPYDLDRRRN